MNFCKFFIFFIACHFTYAVDIATPIFWERSFSMNISNPDASGYLIQSTSAIAASEDFQGLNVEADRENTVMKIIFNFGDCCKSSNTTIEKLEEWNFNSIKVPAMRNAQQLALVKRGGCNWSEKVSVVNDLASLNNLNVSTIFIYDNVTYQDIQVSTTPISGTGSASPSGSASSLPAPRNVLNMADNDLVSFTAYPTIYFVPNTYGESLVQHVNAMYNSTTPYIRYYWSITPYFDKVAWGDLRNFFSTSKGYIAYIIILVVVFIIAFVFLRWWRIRRRRAAYNNGFADGAGFHMQARTNQVDPLPVDIVNRLPIDKYSEDLIKNVNCAICLEDFVPGKNDIRILPCGHGFCVLCIDPWLTQKSTLCPICKWDCLPVDLRQERNLQYQQNTQHTEEHQQQQPQQPDHIDNSNIPNNSSPLNTQQTESRDNTQTTQPFIPPIVNSVVVSPPSSPSIRKVEVVHDENKAVSITISSDEKDEEIPEENRLTQASSSNSSHVAIDVPSQENKKDTSS